MSYQRTLELAAGQRQTLKIADGHSAHWVARHGLLKPRDPDTIYAWLSRYETMGFAGLIVRQPGGDRRGCF